MSDDLGTLSVVVNGVDQGLTRLLRQVERELRSADAAAQRSQNETIQLSAAYGRLAAALGQPAAGASQLRATLESLTGVETRQAVAIQTQIARLDQQAQKLREVGQAGNQGVSGLTQLGSAASQLNTLLGAAGFAVGAQQILSFGVEAGKSAISLSRVENALLKLSGSQAAYANVVAIARQQQALFGGTLEENLSDLTSFTVLARSSGSELNSLVDLAQRLATFDPGQGLRGASAALRELLSGNPNALAARFELPKAALAAIKDESATTAQRLEVLNQVLNQAGITSALVSESVSKEAQAYNLLGAAIDNAKNKLGAFLAAKAAPAAAGAAGLLNVATGQQNPADQAAIIGLVEQLTAAQRGYRGLSEGEREFAAAILGRLGVQNQAQAVQAQQEQINTSYQAGLLALAAALERGSLTTDQYNAAIVRLSAAKDAALGRAVTAEQAAIAEANANALAAQRAEERAGGAVAVAAAVTQETSAVAAQLIQEANAADQAERLAQVKERINGLAGQVSGGYLSMANAAQVLAGELGIAADEALRLIAAQTGKNVQATFAAQRDTREQRNAGAGPQQASASALRFVEQQQAAARAAQQARAAAARATGGGGGGGGGGGTSQAERQLQAQQDLEQRSIEQARDYEAERTRIAEDGARERAEAERRFAQQQRGDRADFYLGLADIEDNAVRQGLAAKFEAANAEAARIAQEQGADAAAEYLTAAQRAIESESAIEQKIAEALAKGDTGTAEYLQGVLKLRQEANAAELQAIRDKGSALAAEQAQQYAAAEAQYAEHLAKLDALAQEKGVTLGQTLLPNATTAGAAAAGVTTGTAAGVTPATGATAAAGQVQAVEDVATPGAIDAQTGRLEARLNALIAVAESAVREIGSLRGAIEGLKRSGATASG